MTADGRGDANIETVRRMYGAFARRAIDEILPVLAADVIWSEPENPHNPAAGVRRGHAGFLEWLRVGGEAEEILALEPKHFLAGDGMVAVVGYTKCRVKATGRVYETDFVHVIAFRSGLVVRFQEFFDTYAAADAFSRP